MPSVSAALRSMNLGVCTASGFAVHHDVIIVSLQPLRLREHLDMLVQIKAKHNSDLFFHGNRPELPKQAGYDVRWSRRIECISVLEQCGLN